MKIPEGYKKTELGILPKDWEVVELGEVCELKRGKSITAEQIKEGNIPVIAGGREPAYYHNEANRTGKTIVVAGSGAYAGYVSFWDNPIFVSDAFSVIPIDCKKVLIKIIFYYLQNMQHDIYGTQKGTGTPHVYPSSIEKFPIPLPPLAEQEKIAEILSIWDTQIQNLESLIQEKQNLKKGLMQQLLSQTLRLRGFNEDWEVVALGDVCDFQNGFSFKSKLFRKSGLPIIRISNLKNGLVDLDDLVYFQPSDYLKTKLDNFLINQGSVLVAMSGATTGKIGMLRGDGIFYLNQRVGRFQPNSKFLNNSFLYYLLLQKTDYFYGLAGGGAQANLSSQQILKKTQICFPPLAEQEKIAEILSKADAEITLLTQKLESLKTQKKGLMQQLLSGKMRVKI